MADRDVYSDLEISRKDPDPAATFDRYVLRNMIRELIWFLPQQQPILTMTRKSCHSFKYGVVRR